MLGLILIPIFTDLIIFCEALWDLLKETVKLKI